MAVKIIYFVHGTTDDNLHHKATGQLEGKLSARGVKESIDLKELVDMKAIDFVISSDLARAIQSADYTFNGIKPILHDKRLREMNYGILNGEDTRLVDYEEHINKPFVNGESLLDVEARITGFCQYLLKNYNNKTIAIVAHKAPQLALEKLTKHIDWSEAIKNDWRQTKSWQPGWIYIIDEKTFIK